MSPTHPRVKKRLKMIMLALVVMGIAVAISLYALKNSVTFFFTPSELLASQSSILMAQDRIIRLGGMVKDNSFTSQAKNGEQFYSFVVTDFKDDMKVNYAGALPSLFREGQGVVAEGHYDTQEKTFMAQRILAKHDENYMPPEITDSMKAQKE